MTDLKVQVNKIHSAKDYKIFILYFFLFNLVLVFFTYRHAIGDFGNYYYGSKFFLDGINPIKFYKDLHFFNSEIRHFEAGVFFENYTPVPPFSLLFYLPFLIFKCSQAKFIFNLFGLLVLSASLYRTIKSANIFSFWFYLLPLIFFQPLYSNFYQGQSYLLVAALLLEFIISYQAGTTWRVGLIIAILFSLKIFPAFIIIVILLKKQWQQVLWTMVFLITLQLLTFLLIGEETFSYYYTEVLPRLFDNDITAPFGFLNQSCHAFLLNCFVFHPYLNPKPLIDSTIAAIIVQSLMNAFIFCIFLNSALTNTLSRAFFLVVLVMVLINAYNTVYGLLVLFPFIFMQKQVSPKHFLAAIIVLAVSVNLPVHKLAHLPLLLQYSRFWLLLLLFIIVALALKFQFFWKYFIPAIFVFLVLSRQSLTYDTEERANLSGTEILYNFDVNDQYIRLYCNRGYKDTLRLIPRIVDRVDSLTVLNSGTGVRSGATMLYKSDGRIKKCLLLNDTSVLALTDENNGVGMYRLIMKRLK